MLPVLSKRVLATSTGLSALFILIGTVVAAHPGHVGNLAESGMETITKTSNVSSVRSCIDAVAEARGRIANMISMADKQFCFGGDSTGAYESTGMNIGKSVRWVNPVTVDADIYKFQYADFDPMDVCKCTTQGSSMGNTYSCTVKFYTQRKCKDIDYIALGRSYKGGTEANKGSLCHSALQDAQAQVISNSEKFCSNKGDFTEADIHAIEYKKQIPGTDDWSGFASTTLPSNESLYCQCYGFELKIGDQPTPIYGCVAEARTAEATTESYPGRFGGLWCVKP